LFADELLRINKNNADAYFFKGMIFKSLEMKNKSISNFQTCVEQDPTYYNAYMQLGLLMSNKKDDSQTCVSIPLLQYFNVSGILTLNDY